MGLPAPPLRQIASSIVYQDGRIVVEHIVFKNGGDAEHRYLIRTIAPVDMLTYGDRDEMQNRMDKGKE